MCSKTFPPLTVALEQMSNRLARALQAAGCTKGDSVALLLTKSTQAIVAMFASLKADCIYVPIDTSSPIARIQRILRKCECRCVLAEQSTAGLLNELIENGSLTEPAFVGWLDGGAELPRGSGRNSAGPISSHCRKDLSNPPLSPMIPPIFSSPRDPPAMPKGVVITHANVIHFIRWAGVYFGMNSEDRISGHPPLHFDLSTFDIYGTIAAGAQIHLLTPETSLLPHKLAEFIRDTGTDAMVLGALGAAPDGEVRCRSPETISRLSSDCCGAAKSFPRRH